MIVWGWTGRLGRIALMIGLDLLFFVVMFDGVYHGKSPLNVSFGKICLELFPSIVAKQI